MKQIEFVVFEDLKDCKDSMLFSSDDGHVAHIEQGNKRVSLDVRGEVRVVYKEQVYKDITQFPQELVDIIKSGKLWNNEDVFVDMNNWFEFMLIKDNQTYDGIVCEKNLNEMTNGELMDYMVEILNNMN